MSRELIDEARDASAFYCGDAAKNDYSDQGVSDLLSDLADALESALPREVRTVEELEALPVGSVVLEAETGPFLGIPTVPGVFHKFPIAVQEPGRTPDEGWRSWYVVAGHGPRPSSEVALPALVLFTPNGGDGE